LTENGLRTNGDGIAIDVRLPWYRAMPLSVVDIPALRIDGIEIPREKMLLEVGGRDYRIDELPSQEERYWYVTDSGFLKVPGWKAKTGSDHDIDLTIALKLPYVEGDFARMVRQQAKMTVRKGEAGLRLGSTLYAYTNEFHSREFTFEELVREVARRGLGPGLEIVGFQSIRGFPAVGDDFAARFKDLIAETGLELSCLGINADRGVSRTRDRTDAELIDLHARQIRAAAKLGFPVARIQYVATPPVIEAVASLAEDLGVKLGLEIHAPHHVHHPDVLAFREMYARLDTPFLGFIPDFGASARDVPPSFLQFFREQGARDDIIARAVELWHSSDIGPFEKIEAFPAIARAMGASETQSHMVSMIFGLFSSQAPRDWLEIMPQVVHVHGKFFDFDDKGDEVAVDYAALLPVFVNGGFNGYMSSEWEGHMWSGAGAFDKVEKHHALCRRILDRV
jgi:sugar phosphate isomerase/epimerase